MVETDVHFPTDINLLWDAMRKAITLIARWCESRRLSDWRQYRYNLRQLKRLMRSAQSKKRRKAKAGVPVELGVKVCILEDQHQFILHHHVMEKQTDDQIAAAMVAEAKERFPTLNACSFDKGFHSPANQSELGQQLDQVALSFKKQL